MTRWQRIRGRLVAVLLMVVVVPCVIYAGQRVLKQQARTLSKLYGVHFTEADALQMMLFGSPPGVVVRGR